jgi:glycolate oxidase iron-sulfur subunit
VTTNSRDVRAAASEPAFDAHHPPATALIDKCVHCGFCLPTCPTYVLWGEEMDSPRGRIYLMKSGVEGRVGMTPRFVGHFDACLGCMACVTACPSGVQYGPLIEDTRAQIERRFPRTLGERLFRKVIFTLVPYPGRMRLALLPAVLYRQIQPLLALTGLLDRLPHRLRALTKLAPPVSIRGLTAKIPARTPATGERRLTVGLLTGCVQRLVFSHVNEATIRVLSAEGCEVLAPPQGCCGALALHAGRPEEARVFAQRTIAAFESAGV